MHRVIEEGFSPSYTYLEVNGVYTYVRVIMSKVQVTLEKSLILTFAIGKNENDYQISPEN